MWLILAIVAAAAWAWGSKNLHVDASVSVDELGVKIATVKPSTDGKVIYTDTIKGLPGDGNTMDGG